VHSLFMNAGFDSHSPDSAQDSHISCSTAAQAAAPKRSHALLMRKGPDSAARAQRGCEVRRFTLSIHTRWSLTWTWAGRQGLKSHPPRKRPHSAHCTPPANPIHPHPHPRQTAPKASPSAISSTSARPPQATPLAAKATVSPTPNESNTAELAAEANPGWKSTAIASAAWRLDRRVEI
jgi:hypothetical protein